MRLFDKDYQKEIKKKQDDLKVRLNQLNEGKEEFYNNGINKAKVRYNLIKTNFRLMSYSNPSLPQRKSRI